MDVSVAEEKNSLSDLIRRVEEGESVVITRHGNPVARLSKMEPLRRKPKLGTMKGILKLHPGWDEPVPIKEYSMFTSDTAESEK